MARISGTFSTYESIGQRESLMDKIFMVAREDTPFLSNTRSGTADATKIEWQTDALRAAATNAKVEGDTFTFSAPTPTTRVANYCQIATDTVSVTRTDDKVNKAGRSTDLGYQVIKKTKELKRDIDFALVQPQASVAGNSTTARKSAGLPSWLTSNVSRGATGANGGFSAGIVAAPTDGTQRTFTETILKAVHKSAWDNGGRPNMMYTNSTQKQVFSAFAGIAVNRVNQPRTGQATIVGAADVYQGDFGLLTAVLEPQMRQREVMLIDPSMVEVRYLTKLEVKDIARIADSEEKSLVSEFTLVVNNEKAHGICADLT